MQKPWDNWIPGVLNRKQMEALREDGLLTATKIGEASIDLTLTNEAYRMLAGSVKPGGKQRYSVILRTPSLAQKIEVAPDEPVILECNTTYVFKLAERLDPTFAEIGIYGRATAKSSVGRVDVLARLIVDGMDQYERFDAPNLENQTGDMYLEITPFTFKVSVKAGFPLSQLRLFYGDPQSVEMSGEAICRTVFKGSESSDASLSVDLENTIVGGLEVAAFCAEKDKAEEPIPLWESGR